MKNKRKWCIRWKKRFFWYPLSDTVSLTLSKLTSRIKKRILNWRMLFQIPAARHYHSTVDLPALCDYSSDESDNDNLLL